MLLPAHNAPLRTIEAVADKRSDQPAASGVPADDSTTAARDEAVASGDPRTMIAGRYEVDLTSTPTIAGIAVVYPGRDVRTRDPVTVKTLRLEYRSDPEMRARFRREARLLQFLTHPNVIRALAFSEERGAPWLVLERVPGHTLREAIVAHGPYSPEEIVPILQGAAAALDHLHSRGLVHLDLRPENIMLNASGEVKLVDFGVAQSAGAPPEANDGASAERVAYLAPEQVSGGASDATTDVYALGSIVYEMLSGAPPFPEEASAAARSAAIRARLEQAPQPLAASADGGALPAWVDDVVSGALEREPRLRYSSAGSFAALFHSGVEGDVDAVTGRPRLPVQAPLGRHIPVNEPGIATKGSRRLANRRAEVHDDDPSPRHAELVNAGVAHTAAEHPIAFKRQPRGHFGQLDPAALQRWLWRAVLVAAIANLVLLGALLLTRGEIPGLWRAAPLVGPGVSVRVAGAGLVARSEPRPDAAIVANLPDGGSIRISGQAVSGADDLLWWPVEVQTENGVVSGYVPQSWTR